MLPKVLSLSLSDSYHYHHHHLRFKAMRGRVFCCFVIVLQLVNWAAVTSRPVAPNDDHAVPQPDTEQSPESLQVTFSSKEGYESMSGVAEMEKGATNYKGGVKKMGSSPPSCEHKCFGCLPCEAIQVPTITSRVGVQYTNYEPEDWKCKCGPSFYSP